MSTTTYRDADTWDQMETEKPSPEIPSFSNTQSTQERLWEVLRDQKLKVFVSELSEKFSAMGIRTTKTDILSNLAAVCVAWNGMVAITMKTLSGRNPAPKFMNYNGDIVEFAERLLGYFSSLTPWEELQSIKLHTMDPSSSTTPENNPGDA